MSKLVVVSTNSVHTVKYINTVRGFFDSIILIVDKPIEELDWLQQYTLSYSTKSPIRIVRQVMKLRKIIQTHAPDVVHVQQIGSHAWFVAMATRGLNVKLVMTAWGSDILINPNKNFLLHFMVKTSLQRADVLTCDSYFIVNKMVEITNRKKTNIEIVYFGIDPVVLPPKKRSKTIYSNRLHKPLYRIDSILKSFAAFLSSTNDLEWRLKIAGTGEETTKLVNLAQHLGITENVDFIGWVDATTNRDCLNDAQFFISIPESDGTSVSLLEAMYYGAIPIVSNLPANLEWVINDVNGVVVTHISSEFFKKTTSTDWTSARELNRLIIEKKATEGVAKDAYRNIYSQLT